MKRWSAILVLVLALCLGGVPARALEPVSQSGAVVAQALGQMGFTEGDDEYTPFGQRYGYPNGYWCDMFVSWCADEAGVSKEAFPRSVNCARQTRAFTALGRYQNSAARGGSYAPLQGDLVSFQDLKSGRIHHVGLVLYTEGGWLFTVEGNALTSRLDYPPAQVSEARVPEIEPNDYVTVNRYPLEDARLHGYAVPAYASREPLALEGFVDLGRYENAREEIETVAAARLIPPTSSHTFFPRAGMARGAFLESALSLCGLSGWADGTPVYSDVPPGSPYYGAVMAARSAGLLPETGENVFHPELWISGEDAQTILSGVLARLGLANRSFTFTPGDLAQILTPYTTRGDLARALYAVCADIPLETEVFTGFLSLWGKALDWPARTADGVCYVPVQSLLSCFPELTAPEDASLPDTIEYPGGSQGYRRSLTLSAEGRALRTRGFLWNNTLYVPLEDAARFLSAELTAEPGEAG